jgi:LacI family transcriptional regulator
MRPKAPTIRDVARAADVSPATVSRYLNKSLSLPSATAGRIERACKLCDYRPNRLAKRLSLGSSELIGLATPEIANPFFAALAAAAEDEARQLDYSLVITSTNGDPDVECANIDRLDARHVDGLIVLTNRPDDGRIRERISGRDDVVVLDEDIPGADVARIFVENEHGAYQATRYLIEAGHRRIGHIGGPEELFSARERFRGFASALQEAGLPVEPELIRFGDYDRISGLAAIRSLVSNTAALPTAIFAGSDYIATGILEGLRQTGLESPRDLSIASFDDMPFAELLYPALTTVRQPIDQMGRLGVSTLITQIRGESQRLLTRLRTTLIVRESVAMIPPRKTTRRRKGYRNQAADRAATGL